MQHMHRLGSTRLTVAAAALAVLVAFGPQAMGVAGAAAPRAYQQVRPSTGGPGSGDVPDNAVYLRYKGKGFSIEYIEGWLQTTASHGMTFHDKDSAAVVELHAPWHGSLSTYVRRVDLPRFDARQGFRAPDTGAGLDSRRRSHAPELSWPFGARPGDR